MVGWMPYAQQPTSSELPVAAMAEGGKSSEKTEKTPLTAAIEGLAAPIESIEGMAPSHTVAAIEGFRTVMCAIIMAIHYQDFSGPHGRTPSMRASSGEWLTWAVLSADANFVVDICFIISGFVTELPSNVKFAPVTPMERARWMGHRLLRLAPLYYVTLFIWLLVHYFYVTPCSVHFLPLLYALVMGQAWSVFDETSNVTSSFAFAGHQSYFEGVESCPQESVVTSAAEINGPTWFVSCLVGCYLIHIVTAHLTMGEMFNATPYRSLSGAIVFSVVRAAQYLGTAGRRNWLVKYPPAAYCGFLAGAFTAKLVQQLPRDGTGVLGSKLWYFVDSGVVLIWTFSLIVTIDTIRFKDMDILDLTQPLTCVFLVATCASHRGIFLEALEHRALVALGPLSYAAYCFQASALASLVALGWDFKRYYTVFFYFAYVWLMAGILTKYVDAPLRRCLSNCFANIKFS